MKYTPEEVEQIVARISELRGIWSQAATARPDRKGEQNAVEEDHSNKTDT